MVGSDYSKKDGPDPHRKSPKRTFFSRKNSKRSNTVINQIKFEAPVVIKTSPKSPKSPKNYQSIESIDEIDQIEIQQPQQDTINQNAMDVQSNIHIASKIINQKFETKGTYGKINDDSESFIEEDCVYNPELLTQKIIDPSKRIIVLGGKQFEIIKQNEYLLGHFCI